MTARRRVAITGIGAITPIGIATGGLWDGLRAQRSAVRSLTRFDPSVFRSHNAAEVPDPLAQENLLRQSGRGVLMMRAFMDEFEVGSRKPSGTEVRMVKYKK